LSRLGDYLAAVGRDPWNYGDKPGPKRDCCTFTADWCLALGYPDPMAFIRDKYASEAEALELIKTHGGLVKLATTGYASIGLERIRDGSWRPGDVGVLARPMIDGSDAMCAIRTETRWVMRLDRGLIADEGGQVLRAWRVESDG
jgi:hypothetical protein